MNARPRTSLDRVLGRRATGEAELRALAAKALREGVVLFLTSDLAVLPWTERAIIEAAARRLYGERKP
jgi:hypothetical protein